MFLCIVPLINFSYVLSRQVKQLFVQVKYDHISEKCVIIISYVFTLKAAVSLLFLYTLRFDISVYTIMICCDIIERNRCIQKRGEISHHTYISSGVNSNIKGEAKLLAWYFLQVFAHKFHLKSAKYSNSVLSVIDVSKAAT